MGADHQHNALSLLHFVRLSGFGGVQWQFTTFAEHSRCAPGLTHHIVACGKTVNPLIRPAIDRSCASLRYDNRICGIRLSKRLGGLKARYYRHVVRRVDPDVIVLWDRVEQFAALPAEAVERCVYREHGSSWTQTRYVAERERMLRGVSCVLANSFAAKRILQLKWGYTGDIAVCLNAVQPGIRPADAKSKQLPRERALRIGVAAKLVPFKAVPLALHVFKHLRALGVRATLEIAGDGRERGALEALAQRLGIADAVCFHGFVAAMGDFYARIDCLLHTSVSEPFGGVLVEAMAHGCPVFCPAIDGMAEIVSDGVEGRLLAPALDVRDYPAFGGEPDRLPPLVYYPDSDRVDVPRLIDPEAAAHRIVPTLTEPETFAAMSRAALATSQGRFAYERHRRDVFAALRRFKAERRVSPP